jgi:predicted Holliday junction resolvase-like endonuclease
MTSAGYLIAAIIGAVISYFLLKSKLDKEELNRTVMARSIAGQRVEQLVPWIKTCKYNPKDMHFLGKPVDYFIDVRDSEDNVIKVVFLEVKSGNAVESDREKSLRLAIQEKRVFWEELRI